MSKLNILLLFLSIYVTTLSAYSDTDLDGVDDKRDRCPNTLITDLVDMNGCSIKSLAEPQHFDLITGITYNSIDENNTENTTNINLQLDYYYKKFSLQLLTSYQDSNNNINDLYLSTFYNFNPIKDLQVRTGIGINFPINSNDEYTTNKTDYIASINISYAINNYNIFSGYNYTIINDTNENLILQDTSSFNIGTGVYINNDFYTSFAYTNSKTIIKDSDNLENLSLYIFYSINQNYFTTFSYDYYLNSKISSISLKVGYYF